MGKKRGRHTGAFLLLFLAEGPSYGAMLLTRLQNELPYFFSDSADIYRTLQEMTDAGLAEAGWETEKSGQPRKWYTITEKGVIALSEQAEDIRKRMENFEFFWERYKNIGGKNG